jgi:hypothetical protein
MAMPKMTAAMTRMAIAIFFSIFPSYRFGGHGARAEE